MNDYSGRFLATELQPEYDYMYLRHPTAPHTTNGIMLWVSDRCCEVFTGF
jgi:hypothetical protein